MEHSYTAYTKMINNKLYFFVKKYVCYNEIENSPAILESYGMHTDFDKACSIARVTDSRIKEQLFAKIVPVKVHTVTTPVVPLLSKNFSVEQIGNQTALVSKLSGIRKSITARMPHWLLASNS